MKYKLVSQSYDLTLYYNIPIQKVEKNLEKQVYSVGISGILAKL